MPARVLASELEPGLALGQGPASVPVRVSVLVLEQELASGQDSLLVVQG